MNKSRERRDTHQVTVIRRCNNQFVFILYFTGYLSYHDLFTEHEVLVVAIAKDGKINGQSPKPQLVKRSLFL